jgi:hypothetical protein
VSMKWLAACGIVTPVFDVLVTAALAGLDPNYSHAWQYISELGEEGRPYAAAFNLWCVAYGLLYAGFAVALGRGLGSPPVLGAFLAIAASSVAGAVFPCDPGCAGRTSAAQVHMLMGYVGLAGIISAPFLAWSKMRGNATWRGYRTFTLLAGSLLAAATGGLAVCHYTAYGREMCPGGALQRLVLGIHYVWVMVVAVRVWMLAGPRSSGG